VGGGRQCVVTSITWFGIRIGVGSIAP
jgi:hypothetical protein